MKKLKFRKWVSNLLVIIAFISVMVISGECEKDLLFFVKGILGIVVFSGCSLLLMKYGRI